MKLPRKAKSETVAAASAQKSSRSWLLFVHQLPAKPSNLRVQTWRRLQQFGAIPLKQSVYVLPDTPNTREDFEWLSTEVKAAGGDADVFVGAPAHTWSDDALVEVFRRARQDAYAALAGNLERTLQRSPRKTRGRTTRAPSLQRLLDIFRQRFASIERIDFFGSAGRDRAAQLIAELERRVSLRSNRLLVATPPSEISRERYQGRLWVTRPRPGVDRMASAWLIRRFIDPDARFAFAGDRQAVPDDALPFDMFGVEFSHDGDNCTFETLCSVFGVRDVAVARIAAIVHDLDLKDGRFGPPEAPTVSAMIDGLQLAIADDEKLLTEGMMLFESLYRSFEQTTRLSGPRPVTRSRTRSTRPRS